MKSKIYAAFGDSITEGYGVKENFVSILAERIRKSCPSMDLKVVNAGASGDNSMDGLNRLDRDVLLHDPDLVTVNFGVNDAFSGITTDQFKENLRKIIHRVAASGCKRIILLSCEAIPDGWVERQVLPYWDAMRETAASEGCVYADAHGHWLKEVMAGRSENDLIIPGDMHPNEEGHRIIAESVWETIRSSGLLEGF